MSFNIRQMISGLFPNSGSETVDQPLASQKSLLDKLGAVFNFSDVAANKNSVQPQTTLQNVATQINLSDADINSQLRREAVRGGVIPPAIQKDDNSAFYLAGGYGLFPEEIYVTPQITQSEIMQLAFAGFADKAKLSEAGAEEFIKRRTAETDGKVYPRNRPNLAYSETELAARTVTGKISIYASEADVALLREIKNRELAALEPDAPSATASKTTTVEQITRSITETLDATLGKSTDSVGGTLNRIGISTLHVAGDVAEAVGATDAAQTLHNANSGLTNQEQVTKAAIRDSGYNVPIVAKIAQEAENTPEFLHDVVEGATLGDFSEKETYGAQAGKIIGGLSPAGDVRDIVANTKNVAENKPGSYVGLGASAIGAIPVAGDIAKPIIKGEKKIITEVVEDALKTEGKEVAEQVGKAEAKKTATTSRQLRGIGRRAERRQLRGSNFKDLKVLPKDTDLLSNNSDIEGFILAGGMSRRMGRDKASLRFGKSTFIERAAQALRAVTTEPINIVGGSSLIEPSGKFRFLPDVFNPTEANQRGAIIGLQTVFSNSKTVWAAILACDLPFASGDLFRRMAALRTQEFEAIAPIQPDGGWQPLCALYRSELCLPQIEKMLAENVWSVKELLGRIHTRRVEFAEIADLTDAERFFLNVNTPADYEHALQLEAASHR